MAPMPLQSVNLTHHFLIAMPNMADPNFARSLTYICEHNDQGALGVVVNRPIDMTLGALFEQIEIPLQDRNWAALPVYYGGPVQVDRGFVLHRPAGAWQSTLAVSQDVALTTSKDILEAVAEGRGPRQMLVSPGTGAARWNAAIRYGCTDSSVAPTAATAASSASSSARSVADTSRGAWGGVAQTR